MSGHLKPPIIIFGNTRSGTSVVQKLIGAHPDAAAWYEPRNLWQYADPRRSHDEFDETDATDRVKRYIRRRFLDYQKRNGDQIVVEKTPVNILRIPYVRAIFPEATYIYIVRSPLSFISSVELKWQRTVTVRGLRWRLRSTPWTQLHYYVAKYARQLVDKHILRRKYLSVWGPRYRGMKKDLETETMLTVVARQWSIPSRKAEEDLAGFAPGTVLRLKYEDIVEDPVAWLERICAHCDLRPTDEMRKAAHELVKADRQNKWRRFDPRDLVQVLPEIGGEMERHGYEIPDEIANAIDVADATEAREA
jgi:hypothetical protein